MLTHAGGQWVRGGTYVAVADGEWIAVPRPGGLLPGTRKTRYLRMPLAMVAAPVLGLAYLVFLPLAGFVMGGGIILLKAVAAARDAGRQLAHAGALRRVKP